MLRTPASPGDHIQGRLGAALTLVEFGSYRSHRSRAVRPVIRQLQGYFGPELCFVYRNFSEGGLAHDLAAEAAEFAAVNEQFWEMHEMLFVHQDRLDKSSILGYAADIELSRDALDLALTNRTFLPVIQRVTEDGVKSGALEMPAFFINGTSFQGDLDFDALAMALENALTDQ